jgi:hypothetical protein
VAIYYAAVEGDPLDSGEGGYISATKKTIVTIEDQRGMLRNMVFIGDEGHCAKCNSTGVITYGAGVSERRRMVDLVNGGRLQAVGGDIVLCKCASPSRIISVHGRKFKIVDDGGETPVTVAGNTKDSALPIPRELEKTRYVHWFYVCDAGTGEPLHNRNYVVDVGGVKQSGKTDGQGHAKIETDSTQSVEIHVLFSSPKKALKPYQGV